MEEAYKGQELRVKGQETRVKGQEIIEEDIIYELSEDCESGDMESRPSGLRPDNDDNDDNDDNADNADNAETDDNVDNDENDENSDTKLRRMIEEVGAETLLEIIKDNRNAAIRQIISEVEASQDHTLQSGVSAARACNSIFDLAAMA